MVSSMEHESVVAVILESRPHLHVIPKGAAHFDCSTDHFEDVGLGSHNGFYDFLRSRSGAVLGLRYLPSPDAEVVLAGVSGDGGLRFSDDGQMRVLLIFWGEDRDFDPYAFLRSVLWRQCCLSRERLRQDRDCFCHRPAVTGGKSLVHGLDWLRHIGVLPPHSWVESRGAHRTRGAWPISSATFTIWPTDSLRRRIRRGGRCPYGYDSAGRVMGVSGLSGSTVTEYAGNCTNALMNSCSSPIQYAAHGPISSVARGNGVTETWMYNTRLQPASTQAGSLMTLSYYYCPSGGSSCTTNNGNLARQGITRGSQSWTEDYVYL